MRTIGELRKEIDRLNEEILRAIQARADVVLEIARLKRASGIASYDPMREEAMIRALLRKPSGPLGPHHIRSVFDTLFRACLEIQERPPVATGIAARPHVAPVRVGEVVVGGKEPVVFFGPCSVESGAQLEAVLAAAPHLPRRTILRGGTYKPRTSPESFQGLREEGVRLLSEAGRRHGVPTVTEILDRAALDVVIGRIDMIQIGARSMYNTELLKAVGKTGMPVLLKRAFMATIDETVAAVRYLRADGNDRIVLCERGIRSFDYRTRNTLDIAAVPLLQAETGLPVITDVSHSVGRVDLIPPCARAALAVGANGLMVEVHPDPPSALSDNLQQLDVDTFEELMVDLGLVTSRAAAREPAEPPAREAVRER